jgi:hypothetical protein
MKCQKCGRRPSERNDIATYGTKDKPYIGFERQSCSDPIHDLADRLVDEHTRLTRCICDEEQRTCDKYETHKDRDWCDTCGHRKDCHAP